MEPTSSNIHPHSSLFSSPSRRRLHHALGEVHEQLASLYLGALLSLTQAENMLRYAGAAVGIRELMKELSYYKGLPRSDDPGTLGGKARTLQKAWKKMLSTSQCRNEAGWSGEIDKSLQTFFASAEEFFNWYASERPETSIRNAAMLRHLDPSSMPLPELIEKRRVKLWTELSEYFNGVVHLTSPTDVFDQKLASLEQFLLNLLKPQTFDDQDEIDAIIREGEDHD